MRHHGAIDTTCVDAYGNGHPYDAHSSRLAVIQNTILCNWRLRGSARKRCPS